VNKNEKFINKARILHGNRYDYSKIHYIKNRIKITIICLEHGEFEQTPYSHLGGAGCPKCAGNKKLTTETFIEKAKELHNNKYDYSMINYFNNRIKVTIICPEHGEFEQMPSSHLSGNGCPVCTNNKKFTSKIFIKKAKKVHGNKYNYSKVDYVNARTKIIIICSKHGEFKQIPYSHLNGDNCMKCAKKKLGDDKRKTKKKFIEDAKKIHGNKYNYSKTHYINTDTKIIIICPKHGEFEQIPYSHLNGNGCKKCANIFLSKKNAFTTDEFILKARKVHGDKYDYSETNYVNAYNNVIIICPKHGEFEQNPHNHLREQGCPICKASKGEKVISNFLKENKIKFLRQKSFLECRFKNKLLFDFYIPKLNCCIEFDGIQHFKEISVFGGKDGYNKRKITDKIKNEFCKDNDILLHRIKYNDNITKELNKIFKNKISIT
jgi:hypothetical protein